MPEIHITDSNFNTIEKIDLGKSKKKEEKKQPKQEAKAIEPETPNYTLDEEITLKADNKTDNIFFSPLLQNGDPGAFINIKSKTPDKQHTLTKFKNNYYIYIDYNEDFKEFLYDIYDNFNPEFIQRVNDVYQFENFINTCEENRYIKCKINLPDYKTSFFNNIVKDKKTGKNTIKPLKDVDFFTEYRINKAIYSLSVSGFWRKTRKIKGTTLTTGAGLSIKVFSVAISEYAKEQEQEEEEDYITKR